MTSSIQSVGSNASVYDPSQYMSSAPPAPASGAPAAVASPPAVTQLVKQNPPGGAGACTEEAAKLAAASVNMLRSLAQVAAGAPTVIAEVPALLGFIAAAMLTGAAAADYANCKDKAEPAGTK